MTSARAITAISQVSSLISEVSQPPPQLQIPEELPKPSESAISFFKEIVESDFNYLKFDDLLTTYSDGGKQVGDYSMMVKPARKGGLDCLFVEARSEGLVDGVPCGTSISAYITYTLDTLEQKHHEYVKLENHPIDRKTSIVRQDQGYLVSKEIQQGETHESFSKLFEYANMDCFVSEGANLLLQRLLVTKELPAFFEVLSFDADTNLCLSSYIDLGERVQPVGDTDVVVTGLQRTIHSFANLPTTWQTYFMPDGHLITRTQVGSPVTMKVTSVPSLIEPDDFLPKPVFEAAPLNIDEDMEMYSKYLERKDELQADYKLYLRDHPEVKQLMADFLQHLLLRKPDDIVSFAGDYFVNFSSVDAPQRSLYFSPDTTFASRANTKV